MYVFFITIVVFVYLIYKRQNTKNTKEESENPLRDIVFAEKYFNDKIKEGNNNDEALQIFNNMKKNFIRLCERFKFDEIKLDQTKKDWADYCISFGGLLYLGNVPFIAMTDEDTKKNHKEQDHLLIKVSEIENRFEKLLDHDYLDPRKKT